MKSTCLICDIEFVDAAEEIPYFDKNPYGVCPTCRRHAEIGKRVERMKFSDPNSIDIEDPTGYGRVHGWNNCLREAKGEKP